MIEVLDISQRRACSYAGLSRTSYRQPPAMNETTQALSDRIVELAHSVGALAIGASTTC